MSTVSLTAARRQPRVVYWNHSPTPYFVGRYNAIASLGTLNFEAWFNDRREADRHWDVDERDWHFRYRYIPRRRVFGWEGRVPIPELIDAAPDLLVQECDRANLMLGFFAAKAHGSRTAFRVLPNYDAWSDRTWWREAAKHFAFRAVDGAKVPGADGRALAARYGLPRSHSHDVTQSIAVAHYGQATTMAASEREALRRKMGVTGCVFVYVGRLWRGKGLDDLLVAYEQVSNSRADVSLLIVGSGVDEARYRVAFSQLPRVAFAGFRQATEMPSLYGAADAMVFPTLGDPNGLVVEEAMAAGLPVISTSAAGDIRQRVPHGVAGFVVAPNSPGELAQAMRSLAESAERRRAFGEQARILAQPKTHLRYAHDFERFAHQVLERPPRGGLASAVGRAGGGALLLSARHVVASPAVDPEPQRAVALADVG